MSKKQDSKSKKSELKTQTSVESRRTSEPKIVPPQKENTSPRLKVRNPRFSTQLFDNKYILDIKDYKQFSEPKGGGFGIVNFVEDKEGNKYAAKTSLYPSNSQYYIFTLREINILINVQHNTIIKLHGISFKDFYGQDKLTIFMDYMENGSLSDILSKERRSLAPLDFDNTRKQIILVGIAKGMMLLHKNHVIHRDLKPENILLDKNYQPRITDFGLAKFFSQGNSFEQSIFHCGTYPYMAPEVFDSSHYDTKVDVYAFGILMYEVVTGKIAYKIKKTDNNNKFDLFKENVKNGMRPKFSEPIKKGLRRMIIQCWSKDPDQRPTFDEIYSKLSLTSNDYYIDSTTNSISKPMIEDDDDDDDEDDIEENDEHLKYCLDSVDLDELFIYIEDINAQYDKPSKTGQVMPESVSKEINDLKAQNEQMVQKVQNLTKEVADLKNEITALKNSQPTINKPFYESPKTPTHPNKPTKSDDSQEQIKKQCLEIVQKVKKVN